MAGRGMIDVQIIGLTNAFAVAGKIDKAKRELRQQVAEGMAERIRLEINSQSGTLAGSWEGVVRGSVASVRSKGVLYAKASVRGSFVTPKRRRVLRFADGGFRTMARITPGAYIGQQGGSTSYVDRAFQGFGEVCRDAFGEAFGRL